MAEGNWEEGVVAYSSAKTIPGSSKFTKKGQRSS